MNMTAILKTMVKGFVMSLMILGVLAISANAQKNDQRKFNYRLSKQKIKFATPVLDLSAGRIVVSGVVKGVEVSGGSGGCFTITVTTYRFTPTGEKIAVRSRSRRLCKTERLPDVVIDRMPQGKYLVEIVINRPLVREENLSGELEIRVEPERAGLR
jgi:hypothetical protein